MGNKSSGEGARYQGVLQSWVWVSGMGNELVDIRVLEGECGVVDRRARKPCWGAEVCDV